MADFAELAAIGREFRQEAFTDEFVAGVGPHVRGLPDAVVGQYAQTNLYYISSPIEVSAIQEEGLHGGLQLIDPEDQEFFSGQFDEQQFRRMNPNDQIVVESFVFNRRPDGTPKDVALTGHPDPDRMQFEGVPEPVKYFMRNMNALGALAEADPAAREHARELVGKYSGRLVTDGQVEFSVFSVSPKSPSLGRVYLNPALEGYGTDDGVELVELAQSAATRVEVPGLIVPEHLTLADVHSVGAGRVLSHIKNVNSMIVFKPAKSR